MEKLKEAAAARFVAGGTVDKPNARDAEWLAAEQELEDERIRRAKIGKEHGGKSLYEVLQANKEAKQAAFEETMKLKNQFRPLDDDEIEFLDSVDKRKREEERSTKLDTDSQLDVFRKEQSRAEQQSRLQPETQTTGDKLQAAASEWDVAGRKRRKVEDKGSLKGVKVRKTASVPEADEALGEKSVTEVGRAVRVVEGSSKKPDVTVPKSSEVDSGKASTAGLALVGYSSDEDD